MLDALFGSSSGDLVVLEDVVVRKKSGADQPRLADGDAGPPRSDICQPPKLTPAQITQRRLGPKGSNLIPADVSRFEAGEGEESERSPAHFAASQAKFADSLRSQFGPDWIFDQPLINPVKIIEEAADRPMSAALVCHQACVLLNNGYHKRVHQYLVASYSIACGFKAHREKIKDLAFEIRDARSSKPVNAEKVEQNLLHYVFIYIFFQSGMVKRDRATHYAQSLQYFFDRDATPREIDKLLKKYGQNKLREAAQRRANILQGAKEWVQQGKDPTSVTMEEVLASIIAEDANSKTIKSEDDWADHSARDVAPGDLKYRAEVESLSDDAEWLFENDPEKNPNVTDFEEDDDLEPDEATEGEDTQPPEVDEFFGDMMRLTAQLVVGLDDNLDPCHREAMLSLVRELWIKVIRFRGLLA